MLLNDILNSCTPKKGKMFTSLDLFYARRFATEKLKKIKYEKFKLIYPHIFDFIQISERLATNQDYFIPSSLRHDCKIYEFSFNRLSCLKISCFPFPRYPNSTDTCTKNDSTITLRLGNSHIYACQPACLELFKGKYENMILDTFWENNNCKVGNFYLKLFALDPPGRLKGLTLSVENDKLKITKNYCESHGLTFKNGDCIITLGQDILEGIIGTTVYRSISSATSQTVLPPLPPVPSYLSTDWKGKVRVTRNTASQSQADIQDDDDSEIIPLHVLKRIVRDLLIDLGIDLSIDTARHVLQKTIPNKLLSSVNIGTLATFLHYKLNVPRYVVALKFLGKALGIVSQIYTLYSITTSLVDLFDPGDFNKVLDKKSLEIINEKFRTDFSQLFPDSTLQPEFFFAILEGDDEWQDEKTINFIDQAILKYLSALDMNSIGQNLRAKVQVETKSKIEKEVAAQKKKEHINSNFFILTFICVTILCLVAIIFLNQLISYIVVIYFLFFILFY